MSDKAWGQLFAKGVAGDPEGPVARQILRGALDRHLNTTSAIPDILHTLIGDRLVNAGYLPAMFHSLDKERDSAAMAELLWKLGKRLQEDSQAMQNRVESGRR